MCVAFMFFFFWGGGDALISSPNCCISMGHVMAMMLAQGVVVYELYRIHLKALVFKHFFRSLLHRGCDFGSSSFNMHSVQLFPFCLFSLD